MTDHLIVCASIGFIAGSLIGALREPWLKWRYQRRYRRSFNHENTNRPGGPPEQFIRMTTTPKPDIVPKGQPLRPAPIIIRGQVFDIRDFNPPRFHDGYQPRPHDGTPNPPPTDP